MSRFDVTIDNIKIPENKNTKLKDPLITITLRLYDYDNKEYLEDLLYSIPASEIGYLSEEKVYERLTSIAKEYAQRCQIAKNSIDMVNNKLVEESFLKNKMFVIEI